MAAPVPLLISANGHYAPPSKGLLRAMKNRLRLPSGPRPARFPADCATRPTAARCAAAALLLRAVSGLRRKGNRNDDPLDVTASAGLQPCEGNASPFASAAPPPVAPRLFPLASPLRLLPFVLFLLSGWRLGREATSQPLTGPERQPAALVRPTDTTAKPREPSLPRSVHVPSVGPLFPQRKSRISLARPFLPASSRSASGDFRAEFRS